MTQLVPSLQAPLEAEPQSGFLLPTEQVDFLDQNNQVGFGVLCWADKSKQVWLNELFLVDTECILDDYLLTEVSKA